MPGYIHDESDEIPPSAADTQPLEAVIESGPHKATPPPPNKRPSGEFPVNDEDYDKRLRQLERGHGKTWQELEKMRRDQTRVKMAVVGDPELGVPGMVAQMTDLRASQVTNFESTQTSIHEVKQEQRRQSEVQAEQAKVQAEQNQKIVRIMGILTLAGAIAGVLADKLL